MVLGVVRLVYKETEEDRDGDYYCQNENRPNLTFGF